MTTPSKTGIKLLAVFGALVLIAAIAVKTGLARQAFFEFFALVKGVEVLGPTVVRVPPHDSPYQRWLQQAKSEIPVHDAPLIEDIFNIKLRPWPQAGEGVTGLYLRFADYQMSDGRLLEIPAGADTRRQRHLYEMGVYVLKGTGYTLFQQQGGEAQRVDWHSGSLFSIPLNVNYQHFNDSDEPVRLLAISSFPFILNAVNSADFIDSNSFVFTDRFGHDEDFRAAHEPLDSGVIRTNFVDDILQAETIETATRGKGSTGQKWLMAGNSMLSLHISEMPPQKYKKAHRHSSDAFILILSGTGYSLIWPEANYQKRKRIDWQAGTLFAPPTYWYHQHLNTGSVPARYLAINVPDLVLNLGLRFTDQLDVDLSEIKQEWKQELENNR